MDAYEATRIVFAKLQSLDPANAHKIMGLLLLQENGEKEVVRLAFGHEGLLHGFVLKARKELGLAPAAAASPSSAAFLLRQNSASWPASPSAISRSSSGNDGFGRSLDELLSADERFGCRNVNAPPFFVGGGDADLADEFHLLDQLAFTGGPNESANCKHSLSVASKLSGGAGDVLGPDIECQSPYSNGDAMVFPYGMGLGSNRYHHRRSASVATAADLGFGDNASGLGLEPCLFFARGYCKNGDACRFLHGLPKEAAAEQSCHESLLGSKSQKMGGASQLMASTFTYSPTGSPLSPSTNSLNLLLQQQQTDSQMYNLSMLGADDAHKFLSRSRSDLLANPSSRQIYLTFPADSTFSEEDVSNYFSIYGPVQDVRIPYQQKRMFGFVSFLYPETVKLILAKGNPHFVCDSRVLVKPYKEKGKVPDKFRKQQQAERGDFYGCATTTTHDLDLLGARMFFSSSHQELQRAIELQGRRFMGLQLLDLKNRTSPPAPPLASLNNADSSSSSPSESPTEDKSNANSSHSFDKEESVAIADSDFQPSMEHNLPDNPFASPTKKSSFLLGMFSAGEDSVTDSSLWTCRFSSSHGAIGM
ncbi:zinc finger CCCH domain-containing protein 53-like [Curcuma longa]|uniref:zinc finger CCCH domain-containing protein 53-like n=1 Tax=Curcuma longa TaxID=136217 RepID=UPI003D9EDF54